MNTTPVLFNITIKPATVIEHGAGKERKLQFGTVWYFDDMIIEVDGQRMKVSGSVGKVNDPSINYPLGKNKFYRFTPTDKGVKIEPAKTSEIPKAGDAPQAPQAAPVAPVPAPQVMNSATSIEVRAAALQAAATLAAGGKIQPEQMEEAAKKFVTILNRI